MCGHDHDHKHEQEVDIVDLLGVVIKRRKFIIWFIVCFTVVASMMVLVTEYKRSAVSLKGNFNASDTLTTKNDSILAIYMLLDKSYKEGVYKAFLSSLLFPAVLDAPTFAVSITSGTNVNYFFLSPDEAKRFSDRYNEFVDVLLKLKSYENSMSDEVRANCAHLYRSRTAEFAKASDVFFNNPKDASNCNLYNYYYGTIQSKIRYAINNNVEDYYFYFVTGMVKDAETSKLKPISAKDVANVKVKAQKDFKVKKVIKYSVLLFVFSILTAFIMAFVIEFWIKNKKRVLGYWR